MFYWGSATSAYQVEGGNKNDFSEAGLDAGRACNHYNLFEKDFDIAKSLGQNAHRFSIEWSRIEPEDGKFNQKELDHYREVIAALRKRGLEPFVTLWHFTNPIWFAKLGGWENKKAAFYFGRFVKYVVENLPAGRHGLKDSVKFWIVLNEPEIYAHHVYVKGVWPNPSLTRPPAGRRARQRRVRPYSFHINVVGVNFRFVEDDPKFY